MEEKYETERRSLSPTSSHANEEHDGATFSPIAAPSNNLRDLDTVELGKTHSRASRASRASMNRTYSLTDGYCLSVQDDEELDEEELEQRKDEGVTPEDVSPTEYLVKWSENDPENPRNMSYARKWVIAIVVCLGSVCVTCTSSVYTMIYSQVTRDFHCSREVATLGLTTFIFGLGVGPMFLAPLSEFYGRRIIYIASFAFYVIWMIPCAVAQNIQTLIVVRFFGGLSGAAFLSVAGGTVGDLFNRSELAAPMMVFSAAPFLGPQIGPLVGGFINQYTNWRWTFYTFLIWSGVQLVLLVFLVPETYHPVLLKRKAIRLRKDTGDQRYYAALEKLDRSVAQTVIRSCYRPMLLLTLEPMILCLCLYSAILLGILYLFFGAFNLVFTRIYNFELWQVGASFLGITVGMMVAVGSDPLWRANYQRLERNHIAAVGEKGESMPEWRLPPAIAGAPPVTIGIFIFAWTAYAHVHWIAPIIGTAVFGMGVILVYSGIFTFLVDAYPEFAASALAANSFARSSFAGVFPLFGTYMYNRLGIHWASSLLGFLTLLMLPFPYLFFKYGKELRKKSKFATSRV
ncbi:MFS multidrug transporter, putative [Talaromyces stipitatus ATCC 10500]|uniref:MFS multidrug transporter, putative n=1 Tax=Talaromyces stipitatus (strain ATCC 10500 / CBS 375.48 / QM 6759 / NRRL 1006) TaxID=441959 RepID=B8LT46_TALSN|nr:MFS multidrug transporter, putative [Talaromyces stipitatus ATCC 10500]EED23554.1 MFS multidrug transporter, putative [Talaromyces stipitatus ATCC 10500]